MATPSGANPSMRGKYPALSGRLGFSALALTIAMGGCGSPDSEARGAGDQDATPAPVPVTSSTSWDLPGDPSAAAAAAGLPMLGQEMLDVHYHAHLDVIVDGKAVSVPGGIGIDEARQQLSALHTHDASGIVHIESGADIPYTLGQLFIEWGQPLTSRAVGPVTVPAKKSVKVFVNGTTADGSPADVRFHSHDEIVVWVGPSDQMPEVPSTYAFPNGL